MYIIKVKQIYGKCKGKKRPKLNLQMKTKMSEMKIQWMRLMVGQTLQKKILMKLKAMGRNY